ncbi:MAG: hypothetical protein U5N55_02220, partial [Cypionkella sp.]|nr:hypothetical protein [Cypionkella sp.]
SYYCWGAAGVWSSVSDDGYALDIALPESAITGVTQTAMGAAQIGVWDRGPALRVSLLSGALSSRTGPRFWQDAMWR